MGCVLCNIVSCEKFAQGKKPPLKNPFYCPTEEERTEFLQELANDIVSRHPEIVKTIVGASGYVSNDREFLERFVEREAEWGLGPAMVLQDRQGTFLHFPGSCIYVRRAQLVKMAKEILRMDGFAISEQAVCRQKHKRVQK